MPCLLYVAGFNFTSSLVVLDCMYDARLPHLFFVEEMSMVVLLFTHGFDLLAPRMFVDVAIGCGDGCGDGGEKGGEDQLTRGIFGALFADNQIPEI